MGSLEPSTVPPVPTALRSAVIEQGQLLGLMARHERLAHLCDRLEACADTLPAWPIGDEAARLCAALAAFIAHETASTDALAGMLGPDLPDALASALWRHLETRRTDDLIHAGDLMAVLDLQPAAGRISAETLSYMLRCFFAACRQRMMFEMLAILTLGQDRLTDDGRCLLVEGLQRRAT